MSHKKLYIIGNGFDLHHGLRTSYNDFKAYLKLNYTELYNKLIKYIFGDNEEDEWSDFENSLAKLNTEYVLDDNSFYLPNIYSEDYRPRDNYNFPDAILFVLEELTDGLYQYFKDFIRLVSLRIPANIEKYKIEFDFEALFLSFNFTDTLEKIYNVERSKINYIHKCVFEDNKIYLGHGINPSNLTHNYIDDVEIPDNLPLEEVEDWLRKNSNFDYPYDEGKEIINEFFEYTFKPTEKIITDNKRFFDSLSNIEFIYVFGHSMSKVDQPYFEQVINCVKPDVKWIVSYYYENDPINFEKTLRKLGVNKENIKFIKLDEILILNRQLKLDF